MNQKKKTEKFLIKVCFNSRGNTYEKTVTCFRIAEYAVTSFIVTKAQVIILTAYFSLSHTHAPSLPYYYGTI